MGEGGKHLRVEESSDCQFQKAVLQQFATAERDFHGNVCIRCDQLLAGLSRESQELVHEIQHWAEKRKQCKSAGTGAQGQRAQDVKQSNKAYLSQRQFATPRPCKSFFRHLVADPLLLYGR